MFLQLIPPTKQKKVGATPTQSFQPNMRRVGAVPKTRVSPLHSRGSPTKHTVSVVWLEGSRRLQWKFVYKSGNLFVVWLEGSRRVQWEICFDMFFVRATPTVSVSCFASAKSKNRCWIPLLTDSRNPSLVISLTKSSCQR
jgi:hypothetical protein